MSTSPSKAEMAKQYIDDVMKINNKFGMRNVASEDDYNRAIDTATAAFRGVTERDIPRSSH